MSDTMQAPIEGETENVGAESAGNRRLLVALAVVAAVIVVGAAVYFLFLSGSSTPDDEFGAIPQGSVAGATDKPGGNNNQNNTSETKVGDKVPAKYNGKVGRDPFAPLDFEGETLPPVDPATTTDPTTGTATDPATVPATDPAAGPLPTTTSDQPTASVYSVEAKSVNVSAGKAVLSVNGKLYTVAVDQIFPATDTGPFKVQRIAMTDQGRGTVKVLYGSDLPVILKVGADPITFGSLT
ncbi:MAG: hypothetical protein ABI586_08130 [Candidatus Nanopelagicales bacterium]